jgi:hypothetical protein
MGRQLPGVEVSISYGTPALKVGGKLIARLQENGETLVLLKVEDIERQMLMETRPSVFYVTDHYVPWPTVLIRLPKVDPEDMRELLEQTWSRVAPKKLLRQRPAV